MTAFMAFSVARRKELQKENLHWDFARLSRLVGEEWQEMNETEREPYIKESKVDRDRYKMEMAKYVPPESSSESEESSDDSDASNSSSGGSDSASDDGYSSASDEDGDDSGSTGNAGPPFPRQEFCPPVARVPVHSKALLRLFPRRTPRACRVPTAEQLKTKRKEWFWQILERAGLAAAKAHWNKLLVSNAAKSPLPGFGKHSVLAQTRRCMSCFVFVHPSGGKLTGVSNSMVPVTSSVDKSLTSGQFSRMMSEASVNNLYSTALPVYIGKCDMLVIPSYQEILCVPKHILYGHRSNFLEALAERSSAKGKRFQVRRCIYLRKKASQSTHQGSSTTAVETAFEFCTLTDNVPWIAFMAEVLVCIFEIEFHTAQALDGEITNQNLGNISDGLGRRISSDDTHYGGKPTRRSKAMNNGEKSRANKRRRCSPRSRRDTDR